MITHRALLIFLAAATSAQAKMAEVLFGAHIKHAHIEIKLDEQANISSAFNPTRSIRVSRPKELEEIVDAVDRCSSNAPGWDKIKFLRDFLQEETDINYTATLIARRSSQFESGSHPLVNASAFPSASEIVTLPDRVRKFLSVTQQEGIDVALIQVPGISSKLILNPATLKDEGLVSADDIRKAIEGYFSEALPRLYSRLSNTPADCYSADQLKLLRKWLEETFRQESGILSRYQGKELVEIACSNGRTYSRFKIPLIQLPAVVLAAFKSGPWPFGPAGAYFTRSWFLHEAVWQMYARESHQYRDNLSVDVADYYCGPP